MQQSYVYILKCSDNSYYTGVTSNLHQRMFQHDTAFYSDCYTANKRPLQLVFYAEFTDINLAFEKEKQIRFSIIVASKHKGKGLGGLLIEKLKAENKEFYGWVIDHNDDLKINGENYQSPMPFYLKHGFEILNDIRIDNEMIKAVLIKWSEK